ncbi:MAG TPA: LCP family protein [Solirubrobacteraceae bacterium]|jgi:LCP family protein required for cell wall assembly|nr:LCP family protein [Solirubrobacteraceae bacterium]
MNDKGGPSLMWSMWKRFLIAGVVIVGLSGAATATVALNEVSSIAHQVFPELSHISAPKGLLTQEYGGGPQTFLILGSDRRTGSKNESERDASPHSDTILLVRFDPSQGQTSVLSIPRDLMVNITMPSGQVYTQEKINAAYTLGSQVGGSNEASVLAAETIKREVFPSLKLNGIVDVNFSGFIKVVDTLGCAYVMVDHRYYNENVGTTETDYTSINLQPGYQKLCYENALDYVRYRHTDDDLVRVARQQDFLRDLREQLNPANELGQIENVAKAVGHAIRTNFPASASELILLGKLVAFSQTKPLRQVKFLTTNIDDQVPGGGDYVTSSPELEQQTLNTFLNDGEHTHLSTSHSSSGHSSSHHHHHSSHSVSPAAIGLYPTSSSGEDELVKESLSVPFRPLYPTLQTGPAEQQMVRAYTLKDEHGRPHHAYVIVWQQNIIGGYYDFEATDWLGPPLFAHSRSENVGGIEYKIVEDGSHIHIVGWVSKHVLYWLSNTLLEELTNAQMLGIAKSAQPLR